MKRIKPADPFPNIEFNLAGGGTRRLQDWLGKWVMLIVYRGDHCPRCKDYVSRLQSLERGYSERGVELLLASTDPETVAQRTIEKMPGPCPWHTASPKQTAVNCHCT